MAPNEEEKESHAVLQHRILVLERDFSKFTDKLNENLEGIWREVRQLQSRPPAWVAIAFSIAGTVIGALASTLLHMLLK